MRLCRIMSVLIALLVFDGAYAQQGRTEVELSGEGWSLWLDRAADWYQDDIRLPPVDVSTLPVNPPTIGWDALHNGDSGGRAVTVPGTVEEYYWGNIGGVQTSDGSRSGGDYVGVSWWSHTFELDPALEGKRITLHFEQVLLRAEVFINGELVGYDVIGNTPFDVDATNAVQFGEENRIDIRITDPVGNFTWNDNILMRWGDNYIPAVHGFGGITGRIFLRATDDVRISDIYVQNQPDPKRVKVFTTVRNHTGQAHSGKLSVVLHEFGNPDAVVWSDTVPVELTARGEVPKGEGSLPVRGDREVTPADLPYSEQMFEISAFAPDARLWELSGWQGEGHENTAVYEATVTFTAGDIEDFGSQRFGFRWFEVKEHDGDKRFYLNGERVFMMAAMTRGFWPTNGIFATPEMAQRDMEAMFELGFNTMLMHRAVGQPPVFEFADKNGLMTYQEPSGYRILANRGDDIDGPDQQARELRREKLRRMVIRDRSFPSSMIYNLKNEADMPPDYDDVINMLLVHDLDPSRIITYNSDQDRDTPYDHFVEIDPYKMHMLPYEDSLRWKGWWDHHYWVPFSGYVDENYNSPDYYLRDGPGGPRMPLPQDSLLHHDPSEIIFHGEEGAFGTMVRLEEIKEELDQRGSADGFREQEHLDWFEHYDHWLDASGFRESYASVDELTTSLGRNLHYYQGRNVENVRMGNVADAYVMNGWASGGTRTDVVDMYRNPTADPAILQHYLQPLYVAVKLRNKVLSTGSTPVADFWIVNETGLAGEHTLVVEYSGPTGNTLFTDEYDVTVTGGEEFGELLVQNVRLPQVESGGHYLLNAKLINAEGSEQTSGFDDLFAVDLNEGPGIQNSIAIVEDDGLVRDYLQQSRGITVSAYSPEMGDVEIIIVGNHEEESLNAGLRADIIRRALNGAYVVVLENAHHFAEEIDNQLRVRPELSQPTTSGRGSGLLANFEGAGRYFVNGDPVLTGLPQGEGMSWEYQTFYKPNAAVGLDRRVAGLRLHLWNHEPIVALGSQSSKEIVTGLGRVPVGEGTVMLSAMNIIPNLHTEDVSAVVARRLFLNLLEYE